jgi:VCBS repeat-containing protein
LRYSAEDAVRIENYRSSEGNPVILALAFDDGTVVSLTEQMNRAPVANGQVADALATEDEDFHLTLPAGLFSDPDALDELRLSARLADGKSLPAWLSYDPTSGVLSGKPVNDDVGNLDVLVEATDHFGANASLALRIMVQNTNDAPEVAIPIVDQQATKNESFNFVLPKNTFIDVDAGDVLVFSATQADGSPLPTWLSFDAATGAFSGTPPTAGSHALRVTATDLAGASASQTFTLDILSAGGDLSPVTTLDTASVIEDRKLLAWGNVLANDHDPEGERLRVADPGIRRGDYGWLTLLPGGGYAYVLSDFSPQVQGLGVGETAVDRFGYLASNGDQETGGELVVTVQGTNDAPELSRCLADVQLARGQSFEWRIPAGSFTDRDRNDQLSYTATLKNGQPLPAWLAFDAATQTFSGTAPAGATGSLEVRVTAGDGHGQCSSASDVFKVRLGNKTVVPLGQLEGAVSGNDLAVAQPGLAVNHQSLGGSDQPVSGSQAVEDHGLASFLDSFKTDAKPEHPTLPVLDRNWLEQGDSGQPSAERTGQTGESIQLHWAALAQALDRLDAQRQGLPAWSDSARGADLSGLAGLIQGGSSATQCGKDVISLACGPQLKTFAGLRGGLGKLSW